MWWQHFLSEIDGRQTAGEAGADIQSYRIQLGDLAGRIQAFHEMRTTLTLPDFADWFNRALYATYLSYVPRRRGSTTWRSSPTPAAAWRNSSNRSTLGRYFVSRTKPGVTRGNHYHHTKTEKFFVVEGTA
jgi:UDP-2-acetamido-2,6-beta-L-arabino-hexul-4-ose reductase